MKRIITFIVAFFKRFLGSTTTLTPGSYEAPGEPFIHPSKGFRQKRKPHVQKVKHPLHWAHGGTYSPVRPVAVGHAGTRPFKRTAFWPKWREVFTNPFK